MERCGRKGKEGRAPDLAGLCGVDGVEGVGLEHGPLLAALRQPGPRQAVPGGLHHRHPLPGLVDPEQGGPERALGGQGEWRTHPQDDFDLGVTRGDRGREGGFNEMMVCSVIVHWRDWQRLLCKNYPFSHNLQIHSFVCSPKQPCLRARDDETKR